MNETTASPAGLTAQMRAECKCAYRGKEAGLPGGARGVDADDEAIHRVAWRRHLGGRVAETTSVPLLASPTSGDEW